MLAFTVVLEKSTTKFLLLQILEFSTDLASTSVDQELCK